MNPTLKQTIRRTASTAPALIAKLPPQAIDAEEALLCAVLLDSNTMHAAQSIITHPDAFYKPQHRFIWEALLTLFNADSHIDFVTLLGQLKKDGNLNNAGGVNLLMELTNAFASPASVEEYAQLVQEKHLARRLITVTSESCTQAYDETADAHQLLEQTANQLDNINLEFNKTKPVTFAEALAAEVEKLRNTTPASITGVPTGSPALDAHLLGLQPQNLVIIAGRPGMGKTSVAWHMALNQAKAGIPIGFFSLEMSDRELIQKLLSSEVEVNTHQLRSGNLSATDWQRLNDRLRQISTYPIHLNDTAGLTLQQLSAIARHWVRRHGVKVIYIDYIGKIRTGEKRFSTREQEVTYITGSLKDLAKQLHIPVVALSQLSREVERRSGDHRPVLSDLRDSGSIEQDADIVLFPYRPGYYEIYHDAQGSPYPAGYTELIIAKYRHGQPGSIRWVYQPEFSKFRDCG